MYHSVPMPVAIVLAAAAFAAALTACGGGSPTPASSAPASSGASPAGPAAGSKMAPGLYHLADGTLVAVGTVEHRDLEGGFWAVVDGTRPEGDEGQVVAVIVNGDEFAAQFREGEGLSLEVHGTRAGEASVRMAGPEIIADRVVLAAQGGPAE
jgi:hypothetical protein